MNAQFLVGALVAPYRYTEDAGDLSGRYVFVRKSEWRINDCAFGLVMPRLAGLGCWRMGMGM